MVPKHKRVNKELFEKVFQKGKVYTGKHLYSRVLLDKNLKNPHYAVVVPKKVSRDATERNTLKRKGYAAIAEYENIHTVPHGIFLFFFKQQTTRVSFKEICKDVSTILNTIFA